MAPIATLGAPRHCQELLLHPDCSHITLDKYARDYTLWRDFAATDECAAIQLFENGRRFLIFSGRKSWTSRALVQSSETEK